MAISNLSPEPMPGDMTPLEEVSALLRDTPYPASVTTLRRWIAEEKIRKERVGRTDYVSFSDILPVQRDRARRAGLNP